MQTQSENQETKLSVLEWYDALVFALTVIVLVFIFVVRLVMVSGPSMIPTLMDKDHLAVQSILYTPKNGDVVVIDAFTEYGKPIVKRIIGIEGDILDINAETSKVSINGEVLDEPYVNTLTSQGDKFDYPIVIPYGKIFVMGDNRAESLDSRSLGFIDKRDILGKVLLRLTPLSTAGKIK